MMWGLPHDYVPPNQKIKNIQQIHFTNPPLDTNNTYWGMDPGHEDSVACAAPKQSATQRQVRRVFPSRTVDAATFCGLVF